MFRELIILWGLTDDDDEDDDGGRSLGARNVLVNIGGEVKAAFGFMSLISINFGQDVVGLLAICPRD